MTSSHSEEDPEILKNLLATRAEIASRLLSEKLGISPGATRPQHKELAKEYSGKQFVLLKRKGVYPYDYIDSIERLSEKELPPKSAFYSKLNDTEISDEDYTHAKAVWEGFGCKTLRHYHDLYNKSDVLLLAYVFENFRDVMAK